MENPATGSCSPVLSSELRHLLPSATFPDIDNSVVEEKRAYMPGSHTKESSVLDKELSSD